MNTEATYIHPIPLTQKEIDKQKGIDSKNSELIDEMFSLILKNN